MKTILTPLLGLLTCAFCLPAFAQGTAFTYQGRLNSGTDPAAGSYDLTFTLFSTSGGAVQVGSTVTNLATVVSNGLFTVTLDFGNQFSGADRWLEIGVRTNGVSSFTTLGPRQKLTPAPNSIFAENVGAGGLTAGTYGNAVTLNNSANSFSGNGSGLANVNALTLGGVGSNGFWRTTGNAGTTPGVNYLGTSDNQPLEIQVNGVRALRIEPTAAPSLVGGYFQNSANGFAAATIAGGGTSGSPNYILGNYGFVGAGHGAQAANFSAVVDGAYNVASGPFSFIGSGQANTNLASYSFIGAGTNMVIGTGSDYSAIGGGQHNVIQTNSPLAVIPGGAQNSIGDSAGAAAILGGTINAIQGGAGSSSISGGDHNQIQSGSVYSAIAGGQFNVISPSAGYSAIGGGLNNTASGQYSTVGGGEFNFSTANYATVSGGDDNAASGQFATVCGGYFNTAAGNFSFAAGRDAQANHQGAFVWADSQGLNFASTANDQYLVRANGGVGINTANPQGSLHLYSANNPTVMRIQSTGTPGFGRVEFVSNPQGDVNEWRPGYIQSLDAGGFTGGLGFYLNGAGAGNKFGSNEVMRLVNGAVGINTNDPQSALHVNGEIRWGSGNTLSLNQGGSIELGDSLQAGTSPFIDFHLGGNSFQDYNVRIINSFNEALEIYRLSSSTAMARFTAAGLTVNGTVVSTSDRNAKENFKSVDARQVLAKVVALPVSRWNYKEDKASEHIGPMAQDFYAAFNVGPDDKHIATIDEGGVALAAIQGLNEKMEELKSELSHKDVENAELKQRVEALEQFIRNQKQN